MLTPKREEAKEAMDRGPANSNRRWLLYGALLLAYVLHNDLWLWNDPRFVLGLPVGLTYHIGFMAVVVLLMLLLVRFAWPSHLEVEDEQESEP